MVLGQICSRLKKQSCVTNFAAMTTFQRVEKLAYLQAVLRAQGEPHKADDLAALSQKVQQSGQLTVSNDNGTFGRHVIEKLLLLSHRLRTAGMYYALKDCQVIENRRTILVHWTIVNCIPRVFQPPDEARWVVE